MISAQEAVDDLYRIAVTEGKAQSPSRLAKFAEYCVQELTRRGLAGVQSECDIPGGGRTKTWDVGWEYDGKYRLAISLKSLLKNLRGTVPNRIDDLMGEAANVQLRSPEIVLGYVMVLDIGTDAESSKHGCTWSQLLQDRLTRLSGRRPPAWTIGTVEGFVHIEVDFAQSSRILSGAEQFESFFDGLVEQVKYRNPNAVPEPPTDVEASGLP